MDIAFFIRDFGEDHILRRSASVTMTSWRLGIEDELGRGGGTPGRCGSWSDKLVDKFELVRLEDNSPLLFKTVECVSTIANN